MSRIHRSLIIGAIIAGILSCAYYSKTYGQVGLLMNEPTEGAPYLSYEQHIRSLVNQLNNWLMIPSAIRIIVTPDDEPYYDPLTRTIHLGLAPIIEVQSNYSPRFLKSALTALFLHELGHALVEELNIPDISNQESVADTFSGVMMLEWLDQPQQWLESAEVMKPKTDEIAKEAIWGEHRLDLQRYYDALCLAYGSAKAPRVYRLIQEAWINDNHERCTEDYPFKIEGWLRVLDPILKQSFPSK